MSVKPPVKPQPDPIKTILWWGFLFLAAIGLPSLILHLLLVVTAASLALALKARSAL